VSLLVPHFLRLRTYLKNSTFANSSKNNVKLILGGNGLVFNGEHGHTEPGMTAGNAPNQQVHDRVRGRESVEMSTKEKERQDNLINEAAMLSQIASAAAAASR
jgi:hypothetical protein